VTVLFCLSFFVVCLAFANRVTMKLAVLISICLVVLFSGSVSAVGEVVLDQILPVKDTKVSFEDPVFTSKFSS